MQICIEDVDTDIIYRHSGSRRCHGDVPIRRDY